MAAVAAAAVEVGWFSVAEINFVGAYMWFT